MRIALGGRFLRLVVQEVVEAFGLLAVRYLSNAVYGVLSTSSAVT